MVGKEAMAFRNKFAPIDGAFAASILATEVVQGEKEAQAVEALGTVKAQSLSSSCI